METTKKLDSYLNEFTHADNSEEKAEPNGAVWLKQTYII